MRKIKIGKKGLYALLDNDDYKKLSMFTWVLHGGYAARSLMENGKHRFISMHRTIMNTPKDMFTDHINGNPLDNRKNNLRICTHNQNMFNKRKYKNSSSKYKGVTWSKRAGKWQSQLVVEKKHYIFGYFDDEKEAAKAYDLGAIKYHKEFAKLNFNKYGKSRTTT